MNKKVYQEPTMIVVKLQHQCHILTGSAVETRRGVQDYNWNDDEYVEE